jgi:hypothetical protein
VILNNQTQEATSMDFIERLFGVSPDGGDGSTELMIIGAVFLAIVVGIWVRHVRRNVRRS